MTTESLTFFIIQIVLGAAMILLGRKLGRMRPRVWKPVAVLATLISLAWPLMRVFPEVFLGIFGARVVMYVEVTGMVPLVVLVFSIAALQQKRRRERRLASLLVLVCALYFVRSGLWMVRPPVPDLGETKIQHGVCIQSTGYTCVAASLVTLLHHHGIEATETEMARLCHTEVNGGATDSRAIRALEKKLAGRPFEIRYERMDYARLREIDMPCMVSTKFGFYINHMIPVLAADEETVMLGDPLTGRREVTIARFRDIWYGAGIWLERTE